MTGGGSLPPIDTPTPTLGLRPAVAHPARIRAPIPVSSSFFITKSPYERGLKIAVSQCPVGVSLWEAPAETPSDLWSKPNACSFRQELRE